MPIKPKLLDLFCGAGGAARGYYEAGFEVTGVDIKRQPNYPYNFYERDTMDVLRSEDLSHFDVIHASPPCQAYSQNRFTSEQKGANYPDLIAEVRTLLRATGKPYIIENVQGASLEYPVMLCGTQFGLKVFRHRFFESNVMMFCPTHLPHVDKACRQGTKPQKENEFMTITGNFSGVEQGKKAMGIDWMKRSELTQAIPPEFTKYLGHQLQNVLVNMNKFQERMAA